MSHVKTGDKDPRIFVPHKIFGQKIHTFVDGVTHFEVGTVAHWDVVFNSIPKRNTIDSILKLCFQSFIVFNVFPVSVEHIQSTATTGLDLFPCDVDAHDFNPTLL